MINNKLLTEDSRADLIRRGKAGDNYKDQSKGRNRYERRTRSRVSSSVRNYNKIDMNKLFKDNILDVGVEVNGETDTYTVRLLWSGFLSSLKIYMKDQDESALTFRTISRALTDSFNHNDVYIHCSCPDWQYRMDYWAHTNNISSVENPDDPLDRPADITNPDDTKGPGCKHTLLVLNNLSWLVKVASVIMNYIKYMKQHYERLYADIIYPAIFEREFEEPVQLDILDKVAGTDDDKLADSEDDIDTANKWAKTKSQFKVGNEYRFKPAEQQKEIEGQKQFDFDSEMSD